MPFIYKQNSSRQQNIKTNINIIDLGNKNGQRRPNARRVEEN